MIFWIKIAAPWYGDAAEGLLWILKNTAPCGLKR
jgi:hypothetical protein